LIKFGKWSGKYSRYFLLLFITVDSTDVKVKAKAKKQVSEYIVVQFRPMHLLVADFNVAWQRSPV